MTMPIPGIVRMSSDERRIERNTSQTAAQIARQDIDAVRNEALIKILTFELKCQAAARGRE